MAPTKTAAYEEASRMLPAKLLPILDVFIEHYKFAALKHHGKQWSSPKVLAELVLMGWRDAAEPVEPPSERAPQ
jgi:hypothetical protein